MRDPTQIIMIGTDVDSDSGWDVDGSRRKSTQITVIYNDLFFYMTRYDFCWVLFRILFIQSLETRLQYQYLCERILFITYPDLSLHW